MGADRIALLRMLLLAMACWIGSRYVAQERYERTEGMCADTLPGGPGLLIYDRLKATTFCAPFPPQTADVFKDKKGPF